MKIKDLIEKIGKDIEIKIDGKPVVEADLELEVEKIEVQTKRKVKENLETLGYSFEVGV